MPRLHAARQIREQEANINSLTRNFSKKKPHLRNVPIHPVAILPSKRLESCNRMSMSPPSSSYLLEIAGRPSILRTTAYLRVVVPVRLLVLALSSSLIFNACASVPADVPSRQWIIGFGWVDTVRSRAVDANSVTALGFVAGKEGLQAGLVQTRRTTIDPSAAGDALVKVDATPLTLSVATRAIESPTDHP